MARSRRRTEDRRCSERISAPAAEEEGRRSTADVSAAWADTIRFPRGDRLPPRPHVCHGASCDAGLLRRVARGRRTLGATVEGSVAPRGISAGRAALRVAAGARPSGTGRSRARVETLWPAGEGHRPWPGGRMLPVTGMDPLTLVEGMAVRRATGKDRCRSAGRTGFRRTPRTPGAHRCEDGGLRGAVVCRALGGHPGRSQTVASGGSVSWTLVGRLCQLVGSAVSGSGLPTPLPP